MFNWKLFKRKRSKDAKKKHTERESMSRTVNSVAFRDVDLADKLQFWKQKYYKKANVEAVFYDNLGIFDTGMETRKTNFSEESDEKRHISKAQKFVKIRENMRRN